MGKSPIIIDKSFIIPLIAAVNFHFNSFQYVTDVVSCNRKDYWKTPKRFIADGNGDCEDFAIAKYFQLKYLGVPSFLLYCEYIPYKEKHMVNLFEYNEALYILDNIDKNIVLALDRKDILPIFKMNEVHLSTVNKDYSIIKTVDVTMFKKWNNVCLKEANRR